VKLASTARVEHSALIADRVCGPGTRLIYYMEIGEVVSRTFTPKDTHTPLGDLIVSVTSPDAVGKAHRSRALGSTAVLGFPAPCFTYGSDLLLPAGTNGQLRAVLQRSMQGGARGPEPGPSSDEVNGKLNRLSGSHTCV